MKTEILLLKRNNMLTQTIKSIVFYFILLLISLNGKAQNLEPTETHALLHITVSSMEDEPRVGESISLIGKKTKKTFSGITNNKGKISLLIPEGDIYTIIYKTIGGNTKYDEMAIPNEKGIFTYQLNINYNPPKTYILEDVFFDTGKSTLRPESYKSLNNLLELMKVKPHLEIEIAGHTDNIGSSASNLSLSINRATAVKNYLVSKGINAKRMTCKGYGDTQPIASNENENGRQKNRRTVVTITKE